MTRLALVPLILAAALAFSELLPLSPPHASLECGACHEGSAIADCDRCHEPKANIHPVGVPPSMALPPGFPSSGDNLIQETISLVQGVLLWTLLLHGLAQTNWLLESRQNSRLAPPFVTLGEQLLTKG